MSKYKLNEKVILYDEPGLRLEMIYVQVGDCECRIFRQFRWSTTTIELKEFHILPDWWMRHIKLDQLLSYEKLYYQKNKKRMSEYAKQWKRTNKDKWNEYQREYKRRKYAERKNVE